MAARSVHLLPAKDPVLQTPSPGFMSAMSAALSTTNGSAAFAGGGVRPRSPVTATATARASLTRARGLAAVWLPVDTRTAAQPPSPTEYLNPLSVLAVMPTSPGDGEKRFPPVCRGQSPLPA